MSRLLYAQRRDKNEREIIDALESAGASVIQMDKSAGFDLLVFYMWKIYVAEVKRPDKKIKLEDNEMDTCEIITRQGCKYYILTSIDQALDMIGVLP